MIVYRTIQFVDSDGGIAEIRVSHNGKPGCANSAAVIWRQVLNTNLEKMPTIRVMLPDTQDPEED